MPCVLELVVGYWKLEEPKMTRKHDPQSTTLYIITSSAIKYDTKPDRMTKWVERLSLGLLDLVIRILIESNQ